MKPSSRRFVMKKHFVLIEKSVYRLVGNGVELVVALHETIIAEAGGSVELAAALFLLSEAEDEDEIVLNGQLIISSGCP
jgi:hypothetical protein